MPRARRKPPLISEERLKKMERRKLQALRRSIGREIADRAFAEWLSTRPTRRTARTTVGGRQTEMIADRIMQAIREEGVQIPRGDTSCAGDEAG